MAQKIAGYWRAMINRRLVSTHSTKAKAEKAERDYRRAIKRRERAAATER